MSFFQELKRRNVFRVGIAYVLAAWVLLQIIDFVLEVIAAPDWILQVFVLAAVVGLLITLVVSWVYEMTPEGLQREANIDRSQSITPHTARKLDRVIILFLVLAIGALLIERVLPPASKAIEGVTNSPVRPAVVTKPTSTQVELADEGTKSVAVLPFVNMSTEPEQDYFSDGISEELLNVLVRIDGMRVPSRTSSFTYKNSDKNLKEIGQELNVDHVLEGSVRKAGNRIRVTAQLIDVQTDTHLWSKTYTRELDDIFAVQDEIAHAIVNALEITLGGDSQQVLAQSITNNTEAYRLYLLGRHLWNRRSPESLLASLDPLQQAVELDPQFERAWTALADSYALLPEYLMGDAELTSVTQYVPAGIAAADRALEINPNSAPALTARAYIKTMFHYDHDGARADYEQAIRLEPYYPTARQWYAEFLAVMGEFEPAMDQINLARELEPVSSIMIQIKGWLLMGELRIDEALAIYQQALQLDPGMPNIWGNMFIAHLLRADFQNARACAQRWMELVDTKDSVPLLVIDALENPELEAIALEAIANWQEVTDGVMDRTLYYMFLGREDLALDSLETSFRQGDAYATHLNRLRLYDPLRGEPRFQALLKQVNLWP